MAYIQNFKYTAVHEMYRSGIPASIKMAQAILESQAGTSDLAVEANNHFGIKCGGSWGGPTYYKKDDDRDHKGRLIPSCFRVFESAEASFHEHSVFLQDPKKEYRYGFLFDLERTDYRSWAWGLRKAGYATNPAYANLLINIIETYALYTFDYYEESQVKYVQPEDLIAQAKDIRISKSQSHSFSDPAIQKQTEDLQSAEISPKPAIEKQITINKRNALVARKGQTIRELAEKYEIPARNIINFNDLDLEEEDLLSEGTVVFIENKRKSFSGTEKSHIVRQGETLRSISQKYGIKLAALERKNGIKGDDIPIPGEKIILRGSRVHGDKIPLTYDDVEVIESNNISEPTLVNLYEEKISSVTSGNKETPNNDLPKNDFENNIQLFDLNKPDVAEENTNEPVSPFSSETSTSFINYTVEKGDTLYSISKKYNVSLESVLQNNQLISDRLHIGQILKIVQ